MMQDPKAVAKIAAAVRERYILDPRLVKLAIFHALHISPGNGKRVRARIDQMKLANARGGYFRPPSAAAAEIEPDGVRGKFFPRKYIEVIVEHLLQFACSKGRLIKPRPFVPESLDNFSIQIFCHIQSINF